MNWFEKRYNILVDVIESEFGTATTISILEKVDEIQEYNRNKGKKDAK